MLRTAMAAALAATFSLGAPAAAQTTLVIGFPAGGATDIIGRLMQPVLAEALGNPVVIHNAGGAAGTIGANNVARARPDGNTLLLTPAGPMVIQPHFRTNLPYRVESLAPVCQVADSPVVLMTQANSRFRTVADVIGTARAKPGEVPFASTGPGTIPHIVMVALTQRAGVRMNHIPFRGSGDVMLAFQQGHVQLFADQTPLIRQYDLHPIATFTEQRLADFPDTPTLRESGHDIVYSIWSGLYAPAGTPDAVLARLEGACARTMQAPAVVAGFARVNQPIRYRDRAAFGAFTTAESAKFRDLVQSTGIRAAE
ncbi:MAG TPA: tripartite tricarboxylate transporter substrate binding protein [Falsiroseomonas sp.]|jgi:tripartite-type tricarboxylate transporter receptor subunit TctC|nr:tripartite tricarboxylate transporter substrate binding protein [Falsiroseomonas sp.]